MHHTIQRSKGSISSNTKLAFLWCKPCFRCWDGAIILISTTWCWFSILSVSKCSLDGIYYLLCAFSSGVTQRVNSGSSTPTRETVVRKWDSERNGEHERRKSEACIFLESPWDCCFSRKESFEEAPCPPSPSADAEGVRWTGCMCASLRP